MREHLGANIASIVAAGVLSPTGALRGEFEVMLLPWLALGSEAFVILFERRQSKIREL